MEVGRKVAKKDQMEANLEQENYVKKALVEQVDHEEVLNVWNLNVVVERIGIENAYGT